MKISGTVINIELDVQVAKQGGGTYPGARFAYRDSEGKLVEKNFHNNVFKFNAGFKGQLSQLKSGDNFVAEAEKEGDFWNWKSITKTEGTNTVVTPTEQLSKSNPSPKSTYETPEERAKKQVYIVRQSAINQAIAFSDVAIKNKDKDFVFNIDEVINLAKRFENYVLDLGFDNFKDDADKVI